MIPQSGDMFTKSGMLNENTWGVKSTRPIRNSPTYICETIAKSLISAEAIEEVMHQNHYKAKLRCMAK